MIRLPYYNWNATFVYRSEWPTYSLIGEVYGIVLSVALVCWSLTNFPPLYTVVALGMWLTVYPIPMILWPVFSLAWPIIPIARSVLSWCGVPGV